MGPKMPTVVCESQTDVSSAIRNSLSVTLNNGTQHNGLGSVSPDSNGIQDQMAAAAKRALLTDIDYEEVNNFSYSVQDTLKSKYIVLKPSTSSSMTTLVTSNNLLHNNGKTIVNGMTTNDKPNNGIGKFIK